MQEKYLGTLFGLAIGDALGFPTEFLRADEIRGQYAPQGVTQFESSGHHPPGTYSDDTQMTLALAQALLRAGDQDLETLMTVVGEEFVGWANSPDNNRAPGATCMTGCRRFAQGVHWRQSGIPNSKGCGSAMRTAPVGLRYPGDLERIVEVGTAASQITHGHPCALAGSVATAYLVSLALERTPPEEKFVRLCEVTAPISAAFVEKLREVPDVLNCEPYDAFAVLGEGWIAEEAVAGALYCFWRSPDDYRDTVLTGANTNGDSDSIACIAGAISGAYNGISAIPSRWREEVEKADLLEDVARRLCAAVR